MKHTLLNYLLPSSANGGLPFLLKTSTLAVLIIFAGYVFLSANLQSFIALHSDRFISSVLPAVIVDLTNSERNAEAEPELVRSDILDRAARLKAEDMASKGYFAHNGPDGTVPWDWFRAAGYEYNYAGENLAVRFTSSEAVVDAWMESPLHRDNILNENYTEIGIGTARGEYKGKPAVFVVQLFGTPRNAPLEAKTNDAAMVDVAALGASVGSADNTHGFFNRMLRFFFEPHEMLEYFYLMLAFVVSGAVLLTLMSGGPTPHFRSVLYGVGFVVVLSGLLYAHATLNSGVFIT